MAAALARDGGERGSEGMGSSCALACDRARDHSPDSVAEDVSGSPLSRFAGKSALKRTGGHLERKDESGLSCSSSSDAFDEALLQIREL